MFFRFIVVFLFAYIATGCSEINNSLVGFWVSTKGDSIIEFTESKAVISFLTEENKQFVLDYEPIDSTRFHLKGAGIGASPVLVVDWKSFTFTVPNIFQGKSNQNYIKAPSLIENDIIGTWYDKESDGDTETITVITQKESSYDYETITLNHKEKTYKREKDIDIQFHIENGFIFIDLDPDENPETDDKYTYYLTSYSETIMNFTDTSGYKWSQHKLDNPEMVTVLTGYALAQ